MRAFRVGSSQMWVAPNLVFAVGLSIGVVAVAQDPASVKDQAPAQDSAQQAPAFSVTTHEVLLDVVVTDGGRPVKGLKASDFVVTEDGKSQTVASLEEHGSMGREATAKLLANPPLPPNTFSNYTPVANSNAYTVILLDSLNTRLDDQMSLRTILTKCVKQMKPLVPIAIFERDTKMHLVQGFTSDPQVLLVALESARNRPRMPTTVRGTKEEYTEYRLDAVSLNFAMLGRYLAAFPGRKNLIWFTGPLPGSEMLEPMGDPFNDDFRVLEGDPHDLTAALTLSRVAVYPIDARGLEAAPIYSAAANGVPAAGAPVQFETRQAFQHLALDAVAESTGGVSYYNSNGMAEKIAEIEANGSDYYTLTYSTTNKNWDGGFRRIKIELNQSHAKLQYRQGYFAVDRSKDEQTQLEKIRQGAPAEGPAANGPGHEAKAPAASATNRGLKQTTETGKTSAPQKEGFEEAMQLGAIPPTEIIFVAHATRGTEVEQMKREASWPSDNFLRDAYKYKPFRMYTVNFTVDGTTLHPSKGADGLWHGSVAFVTVVYDQTGENVNSKLTTINMDIDDDQYHEMMEHGLAEQHQIAVPVKGNYFLRLGVHSLTNDRIGALEVAADQIRPEASGSALPVASNR